MMVELLAEYVLFLQGIAFPDGLNDVGKYVLKKEVLFRIGTELLVRDWLS
ncbi:hypothetical protein EVA_14737, partial [gut metagenome]